MRFASQLKLLVVTCVVVAILIDFSHFHLLHNSDGLIPTAVSSLRWTPYFWRQNYYGMLWPLILSPVRHVSTNFLLNNAAVLLMGIAAPFSIAYYVFRQQGGFLVGAANLLVLMFMASQPYAYDNLGPALFFTTPCVLGLGALYLVESRPTWSRCSTALLLMLAACWVNVSIPLLLTVVMLVPSAYWHQLPDARGGLRAWLSSPAFRKLLLLMTGSACGYAWMQASRYSGPSTGLLPAAMWGKAVLATAADGLRKVGLKGNVAVFPVFYLVCLGVSLLVQIKSVGHRRALGPTLLRAVFLSMGAAFFTCIHQWAAGNAFAIRYWYPYLLVLEVTLIGCALLPLYQRLSSDILRWRLHVGAAAVLMLSVIPAFGAVAWSNPINDLEQLAGPAARDAVAQHSQFISGNYWRVWAGVLAANMISQQQGAGDRILGLTFRAEQELESVPGYRESVASVSAAADDNEGARACRDFHLPAISSTERRGATVTFHFDQSCQEPVPTIGQ